MIPGKKWKVELFVKAGEFLLLVMLNYERWFFINVGYIYPFLYWNYAVVAPNFLIFVATVQWNDWGIPTVLRTITYKHEWLIHKFNTP